MDAQEKAYQEARLAKTEATILAVETAIDALVGGAQSYSLDTGQTRQTVTKANLTELSNLLRRLEERREGIRNALGLCSNIGHQTRVIPGF